MFLGQWLVKLHLLEALDSHLSIVGQEEDWDAVEKKALALGAEKMIILDLQKVFVDELVFRAIQCNAIYEDRYLLGTSLARPVIAKSQVIKDIPLQNQRRLCTFKIAQQLLFGNLYFKVPVRIFHSC